LGKLVDRHAALQGDLEQCMARWETLQELLASAEAS